MMSLCARRELLRAVFKRHQPANRRDKSRILNEFFEATGHRCRPYKKNDPCHVEQKNGAVVRPLIGYARYEGEEAAAHLNRLSAIDRLCVNYFEPSMKLLDKTCIGTKVKKVYDGPKTPWQRLQDSAEMDGLSHTNTEEWHRTEIGMVFQDNLQNVIELQAQLDDLRSNF